MKDVSSLHAILVNFLNGVICALCVVISFLTRDSFKLKIGYCDYQGRIFDLRGEDIGSLPNLFIHLSLPRTIVQKIQSRWPGEFRIYSLMGLDKMQMQEWFLKLWNWHSTISDPYMWKRRMRRQVTYYTISYKSLCWPDSRVHLHLNWCDVSWIALFKILPCCQTLHIQGISGNFPFQGIKEIILCCSVWTLEFLFVFHLIVFGFFPLPSVFQSWSWCFFFLVPFSLISICECCVKKQELVIESSSSLWFVVVVFMFFRNNFIPLQLRFVIMNFCSCIIQNSNLALKVMNFNEYLFLVLSLAWCLWTCDDHKSISSKWKLQSSHAPSSYSAKYVIALTWTISFASIQ